jgi:acyl-coenzyme A thioesterase PaaI-like protein
MTSKTQRAIEASRLHPHCIVCGAANPRGLRLSFGTSRDARRIEATFDCSEIFEGYVGLVHGGIVSAVLDGAMANCLFRLGRVAHTGSLSVRFRQPVLVGKRATVRAWLARSHGRLHVLGAELEQDGQVKAVASAKFLEQHARSGKVTCGPETQGAVPTAVVQDR